MGKWLGRLVALDDEKVVSPPSPVADKADRRGLVSVSAVEREGGAEEFEAADRGGDELGERSARVRARLLRWGWPLIDAEATAERLARRDREADDRVMCAGECAHYSPGRCGNHKAARLHSLELGRDMAGLLQRCPGFQSKE